MSLYYRRYYRRPLVFDLIALPFFLVGAATNILLMMFGLGIAVSEKQYAERNPVEGHKPRGKVYPLTTNTRNYIEVKGGDLPAGQRHGYKVKLERYYSQFTESQQTTMLADNIVDAPVEVSEPRVSTNLFNDFSDALKYGNPLSQEVKDLIASKVLGLPEKAAEVRRMELFVEYSRMNSSQQANLVSSGV